MVVVVVVVDGGGGGGGGVVVVGIIEILPNPSREGLFFGGFFFLSYLLLQVRIAIAITITLTARMCNNLIPSMTCFFLRANGGVSGQGVGWVGNE